MGVGKLYQVVIDTTNSAVAVPFWKAVLGRETGATYAPFTELVKQGELTVCIQQVEKREAGSSTHIDVEVACLQDALSKVQTLGGHLIRLDFMDGWTWAVMSDPDDNHFCLVSRTE